MWACKGVSLASIESRAAGFVNIELRQFEYSSTISVAAVRIRHMYT